MATTLFVPREHAAGERRVALAPALVAKYLELGLRVAIETGAGKTAGFPDGSYEGAECGSESLLGEADLVLTVRGLAPDSIARLKRGAAVVGLLASHEESFPAAAYAEAGALAFALEKLPRISRAQAMDALSSQAAAAGYRAVLLAALELPRFFPMLTTAAGTVRPARVLVIGAGVAGLQAIATAHRLGAIVEGYDVRAAAREQVESLGARFVDTGVGAEGEGGYARELSEEEKRRQAEKLAEHVARANVVISTAAVPGRPAPKILSAAMVEGMEPGSVIVDLAAVSGGNCELTKADKTVRHKGVAILGPTDAPAGLAAHASEMFARNCYNFVAPWFAEKGVLAVPADDEIYRETLVAGALPEPETPAPADEGESSGQTTES